MVGSSIGSVALTLVAVVTLNADAVVVGVLNGAYWLPWLVIGLPAGAWIDRLGRHRQVMMACDAVSLVAFASVPLVAWSGGLTAAQLVVVAFVGGGAKVFFAIASRAFVPSLVPGDALMSANARLVGSESSAQIVGPGVAGLLAQAVDAVLGVLVDAVSFAVSWICLGRIRDRHVTPAPRRRLRTDIADGLRFVTHDPVRRVLLCFGAVSNLALTGFNTVLAVYLVRVLDAGSGLVGVVFMFAGAGGVVGSLAAGWVAGRLGTARAMVACQAVAMPATLLSPVAGVGLVMVGVFATGMGVTASNVIQGTFRQRYCPPELFGRITAAGSVINYGAIPLGSVLGGVLADVLGSRTGLWVLAGGAVAAVGILVVGRLWSMREFPASRWTSPALP
ncbi:MFS transporter [Kibdelosporangium lantanae]